MQHTPRHAVGESVYRIFGLSPASAGALQMSACLEVGTQVSFVFVVQVLIAEHLAEPASGVFLHHHLLVVDFRVVVFALISQHGVDDVNQLVGRGDDGFSVAASSDGTVETVELAIFGASGPVCTLDEYVAKGAVVERTSADRRILVTINGKVPFVLVLTGVEEFCVQSVAEIRSETASGSQLQGESGSEIHQQTVRCGGIVFESTGACGGVQFR